jgi:hypothetical protein
MIPLTPVMLVAAAHGFIGRGHEDASADEQIGGLSLHALWSRPECSCSAAFVHHVGYWSHFDSAAGKSSWPLPAPGDCDQLADFARARGILMQQPQLGDVFLLHSKCIGGFAHAGVIVDVRDVSCTARGDRLYLCTTVEASPSDGASAGIVSAVRRSRRFSTADGDRFIRWPELDWRQQAA